jgi:hypothetical protein
VNEITLSLETLTVQGIQALDPNDNYCPKQLIFQNTAQRLPFGKSPELAHQEDLRDRSQIHSRVLNLYGYNWLIAFHECRTWVEELMSKNRYKKSFYQRGLRAMTLIEQALYSSLSPPQ